MSEKVTDNYYSSGKKIEILKLNIFICRDEMDKVMEILKEFLKDWFPRVKIVFWDKNHRKTVTKENDRFKCDCKCRQVLIEKKLFQTEHNNSRNKRTIKYEEKLIIRDDKLSSINWREN